MKELDWNNLSFKHRETDAMVVSYYKDGAWSAPVITDKFNVELSAYAGVLHYGSSCFEGLKAFRGADGKVRIFRADENARRLQRSGSHLDMAVPSEQMFIDMCIECVKQNIDYLPPHGHNASLYIRPLLFGCNPQLGIASSTEVVFAVMCGPVGTYSGAKSLTPKTAVISRNYDRAAPFGTGQFKLSANYATSLHAYNMAHRIGYGELLFLDPMTHSKIDEFGSSNFLAIKGDTYVTPLSDSVLPSITNKSLQTVAADMGLTVEKRPVLVEELAEFDEVNACGTAVVITPICKIDDKPVLDGDAITKTYTFGDIENPECGAISRKMYDTLRGIQDGLVADTHNWCITL